ncbi:MAG: hypothetical protein LN568_06810 [Rickettsia endosymbiont of Pseudomimeciton antennatum]|nr:hypothetical protein [Rickettsia endosymbiont of Pseudomimeciton antennatum]MCC8398549.1 hypothetical protein [Rickettsia endosymbiont of Labidopullus appendiculatus]
MVVSIKFAAELRNKLHGLNLSNPQHLKFYQEMSFIFIKGNENEILQIYKDIKGNKTVGIGFNMDNPKARIVWQAIFQGLISFDKVYNGEQTITTQQSRMIYDYKSAVNRTELKNIYGKSWDRLKPNEMLMIEDLYWNGGNKLVGKFTKFFKHMVLYTESSKLKYLAQVLIEVREGSNKERVRGIQNRRNVQSEIGDSSKCPTLLPYSGYSHDFFCSDLL